MANATIRDHVSIHGTNPQHLVEKVVRTRIYESPYWKEYCFALTSASILDRVIELRYIGGLTGLQRPSEFLCLLQKLLQIQPEQEIIQEYLKAGKDFKYLLALTAFYVRMTFGSTQIYETLEPLLNDYRKLRFRDQSGTYSILHMDEFIDELLNQQRVCDIILPRLTKRSVCEARDGLPPRISQLELHQFDLLDSQHPSRQRSGPRSDSDSESGSAPDDSQSDLRRWKKKKLMDSIKLRQARQERVAALSKSRSVATGTVEQDEQEALAMYTSQEEEDDDDDLDNDNDMDQADIIAERKKRRFISPSPSISPDRYVPTGGFVSRTPSRSPDREPAIHPNYNNGQAESPTTGYISRSPSRSPDRDA